MLKLSSRSDPTNVWMAGGIVTYDALTGAAVFNPTSIGPTGSGSSHSDWNVSLTGEQGPIGAVTFASTGDAQAGTRTDVSMSPARTADAIAQLASLGPVMYGDGSDGDVTISGTVTLSRDMFYNNLTLATGAAVRSSVFLTKTRQPLTRRSAPVARVRLL